MIDSILWALGIPCQVKQTSCRKKGVAELCAGGPRSGDFYRDRKGNRDFQVAMRTIA